MTTFEFRRYTYGEQPRTHGERVAPDGQGTVYAAVVSPQVSSTAGLVLAAVAALLDAAKLDG